MRQNFDPIGDDPLPQANSPSVTFTAQEIEHLLRLVPELIKQDRHERIHEAFDEMAPLGSQHRPLIGFRWSIQFQGPESPSRTTPPRIVGTIYLVVEDSDLQALIAEVLNALNLHFIAFETCEQFLAHWKNDSASCLVSDCQSRNLDVLALEERLAVQRRQIPIVALASTHRQVQEQKTDPAGAVQFISKPVNATELIRSIVAALQHDHKRREHEHAHKQLASGLRALSKDQREVLRLLMHGLSNKQIAADLHLTEEHVKRLRHEVTEKLRAQTITNLTKMVARYSGVFSMTE